MLWCSLKGQGGQESAMLYQSFPLVLRKFTGHVDIYDKTPDLPRPTKTAFFIHRGKGAKPTDWGLGMDPQAAGFAGKRSTEKHKSGAFEDLLNVFIFLNIL